MQLFIDYYTLQGALECSFKETYRDFKGFANDYFRSELLQEFNTSDSDLTNFRGLQYTLQRALDKHAPLKKRYIRADQQSFMDKELNQNITVRPKLRNKYTYFFL